MIGTTGTNVSVGLGAIFSFIRAIAGDLPDPSGVTVYSHGKEPRVHLMFDTLDDIQNWAASFFVPVAHSVVERHNSIHHTATATWGPVDGKMVAFEMVFVEHVPATPETPESLPRDCESAEWS